MKHWSLQRLLSTLGLSLLLWAVLAAACLCVGSTGEIGWPSAAVFRWRFETVWLASLVGAALAGSGVVYQAVLRNPLADPYLLGVSSGAMLFSYLWVIPATAPALIALGVAGQAVSQQAFAFTGALASVAIVFFLASRSGRLEPITLLLVGVIVNAVNSSVFLLVNALQRGLAAGGGELTFIVGRIQTNLTMDQKLVAGLIIGVTWIVLLYLAGQLNVAGLSEGEAQSLGVRIHRLRWVALILASLLTASAVAISGPIGFVGLVCPHLARLMVGSDQRRLLPVATALGAGLLALADAATRVIAKEQFAQYLLPVGVLTGLLGGPFFLLLLWQNRRKMADAVGGR